LFSYFYYPVEFNICCTLIILLFTWKWIFFLKERGGFPECLGSGTRGRGFLKNNVAILPRVPRTSTRGRGFFKKNEMPSPRVALGEEFFFLKNKISSPSVALGEEVFKKKNGGWHRRRQIFPEC
jgi:hypothetical protein